MSFPDARKQTVAFLAVAFMLMSLRCLAQERDSTRFVRARVELGSWVATAKDQPFWLQTNRYGIVPRSTPAATLRPFGKNTLEPIP